jgi:galactokinase
LRLDTTKAFAPGRVNLIGEHTDYNDGFALPFAVAQGIIVTAVRADGGQVRAKAVDLGESDNFPLEDPPPAEGWRAFVRGAVAELRAHGVEVPAVELEITGEVPMGAGLSSSAALEMSLCRALLDLSEAPIPDPLTLARIGQRIEHRWVGAQTGLLDQLASLSGRQGQAVLIDFRTHELTHVPLDLREHRLLILSSGVEHAHASSGYNRRREECAEAAHRMGTESLRDAVIQDLHVLPDVLARRARHVITENGRVLQAVASLERGDLEHLGLLLDLSHTSLRDDFEVSVPAVEEAVKRLKAAGALGARMIGGGFGGSVLALMPPDATTPEGAVQVVPDRGVRALLDG